MSNLIKTTGNAAYTLANPCNRLRENNHRAVSGFKDHGHGELLRALLHVSQTPQQNTSIDSLLMRAALKPEYEDNRLE